MYVSTTRPAFRPSDLVSLVSGSVTLHPTYWPCVDLLRLSALFITSGHVRKSVRPRSLRLCYLATLSRGTRPFSKRLLFLQWKTRNQSAHVSQKLSANCVTKPNEINCTSYSCALQALFQLFLNFLSMLANYGGAGKV